MCGREIGMGRGNRSLERRDEIEEEEEKRGTC